jgi:branched-chain amino acid transport system substrate-binding protein
VRRAAAAAALLLATAACMGGASSPSPRPSPSATPKAFLGDVRIGALFPLTRAGASAGQDALQGVELAADVLNGGYPSIDLPRLTVAHVVVDRADTAGDPQAGVAAVDRLVRVDHVVALTGALDATVTTAASQRAELLGVPFVNGSTVTTALTERGLQWLWRVGPSDRALTETYFQWLKSIEKDHAVKRTVVIQQKDDAGDEATRTIRDLAPRYGIDVTEVIVFSLHATDLTPEVQRLSGYAPDALFVLAPVDAATLLLRTMAKVPYTPPAILGLGAGFTDPRFASDLGAKADGAIARAAWSPEIGQKNPIARGVADTFRARFGHDMTEGSARDFEAMMTLGAALESADSVDPARLQAALRKTDIGQTIMPWKGVRFDARGQNSLAGGVIEQLGGGEYHVVYPAERAATRFAWPLVPLDRRSKGARFARRTDALSCLALVRRVLVASGL